MTLTPRLKVFIAAGLGILVLLALLWSWRATRTVPEDDQAHRVLQGENNVLREQNAKLRKEFSDAFAKGEAVEMERDGLRADLERFGKQTAAGIEAQKQAAENYEKQLADIDVDLPKWARCKRYCASRAAAGYPCKPDDESYCKLRYFGE